MLALKKPVALCTFSLVRQTRAIYKHLSEMWHIWFLVCKEHEKCKTANRFEQRLDEIGEGVNYLQREVLKLSEKELLVCVWKGPCYLGFRKAWKSCRKTTLTGTGVFILPSRNEHWVCEIVKQNGFKATSKDLEVRNINLKLWMLRSFTICPWRGAFNRTDVLAAANGWKCSRTSDVDVFLSGEECAQMDLSSVM